MNMIKTTLHILGLASTFFKTLWFWCGPSRLVLSNIKFSSFILSNNTMPSTNIMHENCKFGNNLMRSLMQSNWNKEIFQLVFLSFNCILYILWLISFFLKSDHNSPVIGGTTLWFKNYLCFMSFFSVPLILAVICWWVVLRFTRNKCFKNVLLLVAMSIFC